MIGIEEELEIQMKGKGIKGGERRRPSETQRRVEGSLTYLCEQSVHEKIKKTTKKLVSHQDGELEVAKHNGTGVFSCIWPMPRGGEDDPSQIQRQDDGEEFAVRIEPEFPKNPSTDFLLRGFGLVRLGENDREGRWGRGFKTFLF